MKIYGLILLRPFHLLSAVFAFESSLFLRGFLFFPSLTRTSLFFSFNWA